MEAVRCLAEPRPPWREILGTARAFIGGDSVTFLVAHANSELLALEHFNVSEQALSDYVQHFHSQDFLVPLAIGSASGIWLDTEVRFSRRYLESSSYYVDFLCRHKMRQLITFTFEEGPLRRGGLSIHRENIVPNTRSQAESDDVRIFTNTLQSAIRERRSAAQQFLDVLEAAFLAGFGEPICLLTPAGSVVSMTPGSARALLQNAGLDQRDGRLWHASKAIRAELERAIHEISRGLRSKATVAIPGQLSGFCSVDFCRGDPLLSVASENLILARARTHDGVRLVASGALRERYGLTAAEEHMLATLVAGMTTNQYAHENCLSVNTARKRLASLMEKTDCHRQGDLVRKVAGGAR
ncbi:MAG: hypothetical protein J7605_29525 [Variovorax sp.]|nr:hypothetical protein [Variovorax sp.]